MAWRWSAHEGLALFGPVHDGEFLEEREVLWIRRHQGEVVAFRNCRDLPIDEGNRSARFFEPGPLHAARRQHRPADANARAKFRLER